MAEVRRVLTQSQRRTLTHVLDRLIPGEGDFPSAGDLGVASFIEGVLQGSAGLRRLLLDGLTCIEIVAQRELGRDFGELTPQEQDGLLKRVELERADFFSALVQQTYNGYYTNPAIFPLLGYEGDPPRPPGYPPEPFDPAILDRVRERGPIYRQPE